MRSASTRKPIDSSEPSEASLREMPEVDFKRLKRVVRPGKARAARAQAVLPLAEMRTAAALTQGDLARALGSGQPELSRLERRPLDKIMVSTLRRYAKALGARVEIVFVFDPAGPRIVLGEPAPQ